jgi:hypothetical protein
VAYGYRFGEFDSKIGAIKDGAEFNIYEWNDLNRRPPMCTSMGCHLIGYKLPFPDLTDLASNLAGELKRVCFKHPKVDPNLLCRLDTFTNKWIRANCAPLESDTDVSVSTWLKFTKYAGKRKEQLTKVWADFTGWLTGKDKMCKSFSKAESYTGFKHLRGINSRSDTFKCAVGPIFSAIEKAIFRMKWFIKKVPVNDRARHVMERLYSPTASYYATDYTAFESHFGPELMRKLEFQLYRWMVSKLSDGKEFMDMVESVIGAPNKCIRKGYLSKGILSRMSGEMCTSLGNSFSNLMIFLFVCSEAGIEEKDIDGFVEGDDGLFKFERHQKIDDSLFSRLGLTIKIQKFEKLWEASFCGLVFDPQNLIIVTDPRPELADFGFAGPRYANCGRVRLNELLRAKSMSFAHQYPGCPIVQSLAHYGLRVTKHVSITRLLNSQEVNLWEREQLLAARDALHAGEIKVREVAQSARDLVESSFGMGVELQKRIEAYLDAKTELSPIDLGIIPGMPDEWAKYWADYVMPSQGNYPVAFSTRVDYDNIGELISEEVCPGKALIKNYDPVVRWQSRLRKTA